MPDYGTVDGVLDLFLRIGSVTTITSAVIGRFIDRAESEINLRLAHLFTVPVACSPPVLAHLSEELAAGLIFRRLYTQQKENTSEWVTDYFDRVNEILELISTGSASLVCSGGSVIDEDRRTSAPFSNTMDFTPTFSILNPIFSRIDPDRIDDELDIRDEGLFEFFGRR